MKVTLEFNLPEDREDYEDHFNGPRTKIVLAEVLNHLRSERKYQDRDVVKIVDLEKFIRDKLEEYNLHDL